MRAVVVGAGVVGLTAAVRLREAGIDADVVARDAPPDTTSAVAAALWYPYRALPAERVIAWSAETYSALAALAQVPGSGVRMLAGTERLRPTHPTRGGARRSRAWSARARACASLRPPWTCRSTCRGSSAGCEPSAARLASRRGSFDDIEADAVVNCAGPRCARAGRRPVADRGARAGRPRGGARRREWLLDQSDPQQLVYVVPRENDVVLGGTADEGAEDRTPDPATTDAIRARCAALVPALATRRWSTSPSGLRPARPAVRLEAEGRVVHCYGHGGAGVTLAWGCAGEVAALLGPAAAALRWTAVK